MKVSLKTLKESMLKDVDETDLFTIEKIDRYITLIQKYRQLITAINKEGITITVNNASQKFTKTHPGISDLINLNKNLIMLKESIRTRSINKVSNAKPQIKSLRDRIAGSK
ncbi:TPA: terminase [Staphylococcus aureus]